MCVCGGGGEGHSRYNASLSQPNAQWSDKQQSDGDGGSKWPKSGLKDRENHWRYQMIV